MNQAQIKTIFFGTHRFAATILEGLLKSSLFSIDLVVTQPDRPVGRKQELEKPPVKIIAEKYGIPVEQPTALKKYLLSPISYQIGIVAQYGLIIPQHILDAPTHGVLNVHTSLLPKYRGASPIQTALMNGEAETGVTIMNMDAGLDTGPILFQKKISIEPDDTYPLLEQKLSLIGVEALLDAVPQYISGALKPVPQDESQATMTKQLTRDDGRIDWKKSAQEIYNLYRGLTPWPGVWTMRGGKRLKLLRIQPAERILPAGTIHNENHRLFIGCGKGSVEVIELQLEGKTMMEAGAFINGMINKKTTPPRVL